jgi:maleylpyruvate isomerase
MVLACDTHPIQNLGVLNRLRAAKLPEDFVTQWAADINEQGLNACERLILTERGPFCFGAAPTLADICLVPQLYNARRFKVDVSKFRRLIEAEAACLALPAFKDAAPEQQPDFEL